MEGLNYEFEFSINVVSDSIETARDNLSRFQELLRIINNFNGKTLPYKKSITVPELREIKNVVGHTRNRILLSNLINTGNENSNS